MSEFIEIHGGRALSGSVVVGGAKNAVLPMLIAPLLSSETCTISNVPRLQDVSLLLHLLEEFGAQVEWSGDSVQISVPSLVATEASYSLVKALRASFWVLAPLLARGRAARVALPGGDIIGARPVDMHLSALSQMGADINVQHGVVYATAPQGLKPATIEFRMPSVGATHQVLMAAALTQGKTVLKGAAREPEVVAVSDLLSSMGAKIEGAGTSTIEISGQEELGGASAVVIGDRIEAATYLLAGAATDGEVAVKGFDVKHLGDFSKILVEMGLEITELEDGASLRRSGELRPIKVSTGPFPEFATDIQPLITSFLSLVPGKSSVEELMYEGRFGHASELCRMGAKITIDGRIANIEGVERLTGAPVEAKDIRAAASLVIAGAAAEGITAVHEPQHIWRGYTDLIGKFESLGACIGKKITDPEDFMFTGC